MPYDPQNTWILSKNDKGGNERRPDYRGSVTIDGVVYELAGWIKTRQSDGSKFISGSVKPKQPKPETGGERRQSTPPPASSPPKNDTGLDEDVPF